MAESLALDLQVHANLLAPFEFPPLHPTLQILPHLHLIISILLICKWIIIMIT